MAGRELTQGRSHGGLERVEPFVVAPVQCGQRGWKRQPAGGDARSGGEPGMPVMRSTGPVSGGKERIRPSVYGWRASACSRSPGASSTISPAYMIAMRCANSKRSERSCVMKRNANPKSRCRSRTCCMISRCTTTSSAVVGSSMITSSGRRASAIAMITRCRIPPESSCGYADRATGRPLPPSGRAERRRSPARSMFLNMSRLELPDDFRDVLVELADARAEFVLIGGWAMAIHGATPCNGGFDVLVRATSANSARVFAALAAFGAPVGPHGVDANTFGSEGPAYRIGINPFASRCSPRSAVSSTKWPSHRSMPTSTAALSPLSAHRAFHQKQAIAGRHKDLDDAEWLEHHGGA